MEEKSRRSVKSNDHSYIGHHTWDTSDPLAGAGFITCLRAHRGDFLKSPYYSLSSKEFSGEKSKTKGRETKCRAKIEEDLYVYLVQVPIYLISFLCLFYANFLQVNKFWQSRRSHLY